VAEVAGADVVDGLTDAPAAGKVRAAVRDLSDIPVGLIRAPTTGGVVPNLAEIVLSPGERP